MSLTLDRESENLEITDVVLEHNHLLHLPQTRHLMVSQRKISEFQAFEIEAADDSGIRPQAAYELTTRQVGGRLNLGYTPRDHRNHLQSKRQRELAFQSEYERSKVSMKDPWLHALDYWMKTNMLLLLVVCMVILKMSV